MIWLLGAVPGAGFSTNRSTLPSRVGRDHAERRWVVDADQVDGRLGRVLPMELDERGDVEVGQHVAVGDDERVVDPAEVGGELDRAGGVERLGLDGVVQRHPVALAARERPR